MICFTIFNVKCIPMQISDALNNWIYYDSSTLHAIIFVYLFDSKIKGFLRESFEFMRNKTWFYFILILVFSWLFYPVKNQSKNNNAFFFFVNIRFLVFHIIKCGMRNYPKKLKTRSIIKRKTNKVNIVMNLTIYTHIEENGCKYQCTRSECEGKTNIGFFISNNYIMMINSIQWDRSEMNGHSNCVYTESSRSCFTVGSPNYCFPV